MAKKPDNKSEQPSLEQLYLSLTEHLVRKYNMSLSFLTTQTDSAREHPLPSTNYELDHLLTSEQAAGVLGLSPKTLANWRVQGIENLPYRKVGKAIRYKYGDLLAFIDLQKRENTSQK